MQTEEETRLEKWRPKKFGKLIEKLRTERLDIDNRIWTRQLLAKKTKGKLNATLIGNAERGDKVIIVPDALMSLAEALEMNTEERKEFCIAASWVESHQIASPRQDPQKILEHVKDTISQLYAPGYVIDQYSDIIAMNEAVAQFFNLEEMKPPLSHWKNNSTPINIMDVIFGHLATRLTSNHHLESFITRTIKVFRIRSLRYRIEPYYDILIKRLYDTYPSFRRFWEEAKYYHEEDYFQGKPIFDKFSPHQFVTFTIPFLTKYGNLEVVSFVPTNEVTYQTFGKIIDQYGNQAHQLTHWPNKPR